MVLAEALFLGFPVVAFSVGGVSDAVKNEETGFLISKVEKIYDAFASPGALKSKTIFFIGEYTDKDKVSDGGGLEDEGEEIEVIEMPFKAAVKMLENNEIQDMKTIMLLQYAMLKIFKS